MAELIKVHFTKTSQLPLRRARRNQTSKARRSDFVRRRPPNRSVRRCLAGRCGLPLFPTLRLGFDTCRPLLGKFSGKEQTAAELILCSKFLVGVIGLNTNVMQPLAVRRCRNREREYIISQSLNPFDGFSTFATTSCLSRSKMKIVGHGWCSLNCSPHSWFHRIHRSAPHARATRHCGLAGQSP